MSITAASFREERACWILPLITLTGVVGVAATTEAEVGTKLEAVAVLVMLIPITLCWRPPTARGTVMALRILCTM